MMQPDEIAARRHFAYSDGFRDGVSPEHDHTQKHALAGACDDYQRGFHRGQAMYWDAVRAHAREVGYAIHESVPALDVSAAGLHLCATHIESQPSQRCILYRTIAHEPSLLDMLVKVVRAAQRAAAEAPLPDSVARLAIPELRVDRRGLPSMRLVWSGRCEPLPFLPDKPFAEAVVLHDVFYREVDPTEEPEHEQKAAE